MAARRVTLKQKVQVYEALLHELQMYAEVTMDPASVKEIIDRICSWSYAHRCGNGQNSDAEQQRIIDRAFHRLLERKSKP